MKMMYPILLLLVYLLVLPSLLTSLESDSSFALNVSLVPPIELLHALSKYTNDPVRIENDAKTNYHDALMRKLSLIHI